MYLFALHGRIAGWWGRFGIAQASVLCFSGVVMAWYGVNFWLGKGLHSYGFGTGGGEYVAVFLGLETLFLVGVSLRCRKWPGQSLLKKDRE